jgi:hypothetical protein
MNVGENFYILLSNIQDLILQNNIINTNINTFVVDEISIEYLTIFDRPLLLRSSRRMAAVLTYHISHALKQNTSNRHVDTISFPCLAPPTNSLLLCHMSLADWLMADVAHLPRTVATLLIAWLMDQNFEKYRTLSED